MVSNGLLYELELSLTIVPEIANCICKELEYAANITVFTGQMSLCIDFSINIIFPSTHLSCRPKEPQALVRGTTRPTHSVEGVVGRPTTYRRRNVRHVAIHVQEREDVSKLHLRTYICKKIHYYVEL